MTRSPRVFATSMFSLALALAMAGTVPLQAHAGAWPAGVKRVALNASRVVGEGVYGTAVAAARRANPGWSQVHDVVVASGETGALSDAAAASSLCWAYRAPLLLTARTSLPKVTRDALAQIVSANTSVTVHVVGSSSAISSVCLAKIVAAAGTATVEQPWKTASRYSLAAAIAQRVRSVAETNGSVVPSAALVVEGSRASDLWDVAAAASVSRASGVPILFASTGDVPPSTAAALSAAGHPRVIVVGGADAISSAVFTRLGAAERWSGPSHTETAVSVARHAVARGWSLSPYVALASTAPNAIVAGVLAGAQGGVFLATDAARVSQASWSYLSARGSDLSTAYAVGGDSIGNAEIAELRGAPSQPWFASGAPGKYVGKKARITGWVGGNTTRLAIYVHGKKARDIAVKPWSRFNFTSVSMSMGTARVSAVAGNPDRGSAKVSRMVHRLEYPFATCIVVDKSQFKLYWVKDNHLVRTFPIAIGRLGMATPSTTWKILAKYHTSPDSVSGPRKMRLFRRRGGRWVPTPYGIHGTNQQWVIGTRASHGCIRMYNRDVLKLFPLVKLGTMVVTRE